MSEYSYFWLSPTGDGSLNPYDADAYSDFFRKLFEADRSVPNVLKGYLNNLEVSNPSALNIRVESGVALVDGKLYISDTAINYSLVPPGSGIDYCRIILRKDWANKSVLQFLTQQNGSYLALTQTDGTLWEVQLAQFTIDNTGLLSSITDNRRTMSSNRYHGVKLVNSRQTYRHKVQLGVVQWTGAAASSGNVTVTFPYAFDTTPVVICSHLGNFYVNCVVQPTTGNVVIYWKDVDGVSHATVNIAWMAMGEMLRR